MNKNNNLYTFLQELHAQQIGGNIVESFGGNDYGRYIGQGGTGSMAGGYQHPSYIGSFGGGMGGDGNGNVEAYLDTIDPNASNLTIVVKNTDTANSVAGVVLFGANRNLFGTTNFNNNVDVQITCPQSTYAEVLTESLTQPTFMKHLRLKTSSTSNQFAQSFKLISFDSAGKETSTSLNTLNWTNPRNQDDKTIDAPPGGFAFVLNGKNEIKFDLLAGETLTFFFTIGSKADLTKLLQNAPAVLVSMIGNPAMF